MIYPAALSHPTPLLFQQEFDHILLHYALIYVLFFFLDHFFWAAKLFALAHFSEICTTFLAFQHRHVLYNHSVVHQWGPLRHKLIHR